MISSLGLSNVTTDNDSTRYDKISNSLLMDINRAAKNADLKVTITTAKSGHRKIAKSGHKSRHTTGDAVDIAIINGVRITKNLGDRLVKELKKLGYDSSGNESGNVKAVLWQVNDHYDHIHVSNTTDTPTSSNDDIDDIDDESSNNGFAKKYMMSLLSKAFGMNESKQNRILKDIEKIKNLL